MITTATKQQLEQALKEVNAEQGYKLSFDRLDQITRNRIAFTLKTPSKVKGARLSHSGRNLPKASWHAHGNLFDKIFEINPEAIVLSSSPKGLRKITKQEGNWVDYNVGSTFSPVMFSDLSIGENEG